MMVGLTGGIGSGKSTVEGLFSELGVPTVDADVIARALVQPNMPALHQIKVTLGQQYIKENGELNRSLLRHDIFKNPKLKKQLEAILHPLIHEAILKEVATLRAPYVIIVVPLLVESIEKYQWLDRILVIDVPEEIQIQRAKQRDIVDDQHIKRIIEHQATSEDRLKLADDVIINTFDLNHLRNEVSALHQKYLKLVKTK